jgi:hypothetical protein
MALRDTHSPAAMRSVDPSEPAAQLVLRVLTSTGTSALRTAGGISTLLGVPEAEVAATLATLKAAGVAYAEWNGMEYVWRPAKAEAKATAAIDRASR